MNVNAQKLTAAVAAGDKRLKRIRDPESPDYVPRTTMVHHEGGTVPNLRHARSYFRALRLSPWDWFERAP